MPDIDYSSQHYVDHLLAFIDAIGADKVLISGESLSAKVAAGFALQHPSRIHKIVMNTDMLLPPEEFNRVHIRSLLK
jgi:2-hydroxy-6-oxonona-2,4-dienedioate hydrolase